MTLAENISVGRKSIATARQRGVDTSGWEAVLADLEQQQLLAWAAEVAESDMTLVSPITYLETPLRPITTTQVSQSIRRYLTTVARSELNRATGGWKIPYVAEAWRGAKPAFDIVDAASGEVVFAAGTKISPRAANKAEKDGLKDLLSPTEEEGLPPAGKGSRPFAFPVMGWCRVGRAVKRV